MFDDDELDDYGRPRFTGRSLVAVHLNRPSEYIHAFINELSKIIPPFAENAEKREGWSVFGAIGAAVIPYPPAELRSLQAENPESLRGVCIDREHYLYTQTLSKRRAAHASSPLKAMGVTAAHKGRVKVMVLDTGIEDNHPDFVKRHVQTLSLNNSGTDDPTGHGTHCTGLACGPAAPADGGPRYGVATESTIIHGKVRSKSGQMDDKAILDGIDWAVGGKNDIVVINMSIESQVAVNGRFNDSFELVAARALNAGILLVAAAGNDPAAAEWPVQHPANCPSVMAVASLNVNLEASDESSVGINPGQYIDVAAPGYQIRSSDLCGGYSLRSGTSMASAFVAGIAALWADTTAEPRGRKLWCAITGSAIPVKNAGYAEVGAGMVQAP